MRWQKVMVEVVKAAVVAVVTLLVGGCALGLQAERLALDAQAGELRRCELSLSNPQASPLEVPCSELPKQNEPQGSDATE